ncbi:MAG TPA: hypothetical protein VFS21_20380 [Roseiflexaceae bacterium]|nr:hypothetical protein [Roseiflexaceae bacterium]
MRTRSRISRAIRARHAQTIQRKPVAVTSEVQEPAPPPISVQLQAAQRGHSLSRISVGGGVSGPTVQRKLAEGGSGLSAEELAERIANCIGIWETNRGKDAPNPRESSLDTVADIPASMATIEQATMPYAISVLLKQTQLRSKASPELTKKELVDAQNVCVAVGSLLDAVDKAAAAEEDVEAFITANADLIAKTYLGDADVRQMFEAVDLKKTIKDAHGRVQETAQKDRKAKVQEEIDAIPEEDRLGIAEGSLSAYIKEPKKWGENKASWQRKAVNAMPGDIGTRIESVSESDEGTALVIPTVLSRLQKKIAEEQEYTEEEIIKAVAQQNNPNETGYGANVYKTYQRIYGTTPAAETPK